MIKNIIVAFLIFAIPVFVSAQTGGYMGKKHHLSIDVNWHPLTYDYKLLNDYVSYRSDANINKKHSITFRPGYELVIGKSFTIGIDAGYLFYSGGDIKSEVASEDPEGSILFNTPNPTVIPNSNTSTVDPKFYVSGFDLKLKLNIYNYRSRGIIAPLGSHFSFIIGTPFYNTSFSKTAVFKYTNLGLGVEFGKRYIISGFLTIDYGITAMATLSATNVFEGSEKDELYYNSLSASSEVEGDYVQMQSLSIYLKIGYLL